MSPTIITFSGTLTIDRYPEVHDALEATKHRDAIPLVLDLGGVDAAEPMVAAEIVLFVRRRLRHRSNVAIVPPAEHHNWLTGAESLRTAVFCTSRDEAVNALGGNDGA